MSDMHQEPARVRIGSIVIRCHEFDRMPQFWRAALHYVVARADEDPDGNLFRVVQV
jgi:hypothetical protein